MPWLMISQVYLPWLFVITYETLFLFNFVKVLLRKYANYLDAMPSTHCGWVDTDICEGHFSNDCRSPMTWFDHSSLWFRRLVNECFKAYLESKSKMCVFSLTNTNQNFVVLSLCLVSLNPQAIASNSSLNLRQYSLW